MQCVLSHTAMLIWKHKGPRGVFPNTGYITLYRKDELERGGGGGGGARLPSCEDGKGLAEVKVARKLISKA